MIRLNQIKLRLDEDMSSIPQKISKALKIPVQDIKGYRVYRESIDARRGEVKFIYTLDVSVKKEAAILKKNKKLELTPDLTYKRPKRGLSPMTKRPVIVGMGPSGMFAGLILAEAGFNPILLERGKSVNKRTKDIQEFWKTGKLNIESNVQFGEGGAGTFSDGKLTTRIKDPRCRKVLSEFIKFGAPEEIIYAQRPHIGTDILKNVIKEMRNRIIELGGEVRFESKVTDLIKRGKTIKGVVINKEEELYSDDIIFAIGHSARDTYEMLYENEVVMTQKALSLGFRIEHPQNMIDKAQYKKHAGHPRLEAASYNLSHKASSERGVYTFCMCPGGEVIAAASEENTLVVNGMSEHARDKANANSAVLVQVKVEDYEGKHPLAGMYMQREIEKKAFELGGGDYTAPVQLLGDFMNNVESKAAGKIKPSYAPKVKYTNLAECMPEFVVEGIREAIPEFGKKIKGFDREDAILTGVETRSSSPVRIERGRETFESANLKGMYPCGEGAGYAGGIMSAAVDGINTAEKIIMKYSPDFN